MSFNPEARGRIKVLVVDDHMLFAEGTVALLSIAPRILVIGVAKNAIECLDFMCKNPLDVVLLDIQLPDTSGIDLIDKMKKLQPEIKILMLTGQNPKGFVTRSISKGARGFLLKDCSAKEMVEAILRVFNGSIYFSQNVEVFLPSEKNSNNLHPSVEVDIQEELTPREREIIELVSRGLNNNQIASSLGIKVRTANFHVSNILLKLGVSTRLQAALKWSNLDKITY